MHLTRQKNSNTRRISLFWPALYTKWWLSLAATLLVARHRAGLVLRSETNGRYIVFVFDQVTQINSA